MPQKATAWELAQALAFPPPQTPVQMGLNGADPESKFYGQPYPVATLEIEAPYLLRRCRMALREIAECWQALAEFNLRNPGFAVPGYAISGTEARVYQRITERYIQFAEPAQRTAPAQCAEGPVS